MLNLFYLNANAHQYLAGRNSGDIILDAQLAKELKLNKDTILFLAELNYYNKTPGFYEENYYSNTIKWELDNLLKKEKKSLSFLVKEHL